MSLTTHLLALASVTLLAVGQLLFKTAADAWQRAGTFLHRGVAVPVAGALAIYAVAMLLWILALRSAPLSRLYPYTALSYVLVALASWLVLREHISLRQVGGHALVVAGLLVIAAS